MNIDIKWDTQQREALICQFEGDWTWHECREAMQVMLYMQDGSQLAVNHIYDLSGSTLTTRACINRLQKLLKIDMDPAPQNIVIVDKPFRVHTLEDLLSTVTQSKDNIRFAKDIAEARECLMN